jgi:hypothetical protein
MRAAKRKELTRDSARVAGPETATKSVRLLGGVNAVAVDGSAVDVPSVSERRVLAIVALHSPRRLRSESLADIVGISPGALRISVSMLRTAIGGAVLQTVSTGFSVVIDVDALRFCESVADAADAEDRIRALERALTLWTGPALEEFAGEEWADGEIARFTELHAVGRPTRSRCSKLRSRNTLGVGYQRRPSVVAAAIGFCSCRSAPRG